eukprot:gnl/Spiro4/14818_TR7991_c0_g1_i1.p2 gnl/Spiro4/14818_TR7991_c0_g1~~gnl/Spiro4/14818_TR7991_c0_g1_i1.p2  ORF type:complete len:159 (-),score=73.68 gnl/Spiro4/14818_TR7991_c0_g1_i1:106-582(-)
MVIKTDVCFFTELKIYPGHGHRLVRKDGKLLAFISTKVRSLYTQKKKAQRLCWTQAWRRLHKKGTVEAEAKKKAKKVGKVFKAIAGLSIEDLKKKRMQTPTVRKAARDDAARAAKERARKVKDEKKKAAATGKAPKKAAAPKAFVKTPKSRKTAGVRR